MREGSMAYSFTEKKRIRKNFGKRPGILEVPFLLATQIDSYRYFLQADSKPKQREDVGSACGLQVRAADRELLGNAVLEYVSYRLGEPCLMCANVICAAPPMRRRCACCCAW
jgi:DNA-directed RNA polymerase subunit beta